MSVNLGRVAFVAKGSYDAATTYQQYDYVTHNNGSYVYISPIPAAGKPVTDAGYWQPLIDPAGMNNATEAANTAATKAETNAQTAATAAETANTAAAAADEARQNIQGDLAQKAPAIFVDANGDLVHIKDGATMPVKSLISHIEPVQEGSGEASLDNKRPISGWDRVTARRTGANLLDYDAWKDKPVNNGTAVWANNGVAITAGANDAYTEAAHAYIACVPGVKYVLSWAHSGGEGVVYIFPKGSTVGLVSIPSGAGRLEYTPTEGVNFFTFRVGATNAGSTAVYTDVCVNIGSDHRFTPYQGKTLTDTLPETVYGGKRNWTTGVLTVTHYKYVADGTAKIFATPHSDSNYRVGITLPKTSVAYNIGNPICDRIAHNADVFFDAYDNVGFCVHDGALYIRFGRDSGLTTTDAIINYLTANPMTFVYQLATPYTIQLTPQQLSTLKGENNIWSDAGQTEVTYAADTKLYADGKVGKTMIGPVEQGMVASQNYNIGDLFVAQNALYRATVAIASGETIVPGGNCKETTVAENLGGGGGSGGNYVLPIASADTLGGVKVGSGLSMDGDVLEAEVQKEDIDKIYEEKIDKEQGVDNAEKLLYVNGDGDTAHLPLAEGFEYIKVPGKNIVHGEWKKARYVDGVWTVIPAYGNTSNIAIEDKFPVVPGGTYTASYAGNYSGQQGCLYVHFFDENMNFIKYINAIVFSGSNTTGTFTVTDNTHYIAVQNYCSSNKGTVVEEAIPRDLMIEKGDKATAYEPYKSVDTLSIAYYEDLVSPLHRFAVPNYYHANDYLKTKCTRIRELAEECAGNGDVFFFTTDQHWPLNAQKSPALMKYIASSVHIPQTICGGDTADYASEDFANILDEAYDGEIHHAMGNHDYFGNVDGNKLAYIFDMGKKEQIGNAERHYYYVDNPQQKIRYIVLSVYNNNAGTIVDGYEDAQVAWLTNTALDVEDDWTVVVISHMLYYTETNPPSYLQWPSGATAILQALESATCNVACIIQGHLHKDRICHTPGGIPVVTVTCDKCDPWINADGDQEPWLSTRVRGTITEQAFDVVVLDKVQRKLTFVRIGEPADNWADGTSTGTVEERAVTY